MLAALCVCGFKKMHPRWCWLLFEFVGSKKCTRDVSEFTAVFMGSKKCTRDLREVTTMFADSKECIRDGVWYSLCLRVQKNAPVIVLVNLCVYGFKKCTRDSVCLLLVPVG